MHRLWLLIVGIVVCSAVADTYPVEAWPATADVQALNGTNDPLTGWFYIASGTSEQSSPPLIVQIDRGECRRNRILSAANEGRVVKVDSTHIGVFPLTFRVAGTDCRYTGSVSTAVSTVADTYYVYLAASGTSGVLNVVSDATGWPLDQTTFVPLAEVVVASGAISSISDVRNRLVYATAGSGSVGANGTDASYWTIDQDNTGAGANSEVRFNRGSTNANDAAFRWNETSDWFEALTDGTAFAPVKALSLVSTVSTGTAPLTVASTTKVTNLNADLVDGISFDSSPTTWAVPYGSVGGTLAFSDASSGAEGQAFVTTTSGPQWRDIGESAGLQPWSSDLAAIASVATTGLLSLTGSGTASARTITSGDGVVSVTNGGGVDGNPTVAISGMTQYGVVVGAAGGTIASLAVPTDNTVLAGRLGNTPVFRKIVPADLDTSFRLPEYLIATAGTYSGYDGCTLKSTDADEVHWEFARFVEQKNTSQTLVYSSNDHVITNQSASSKPTLTLPEAIQGLLYSFVVQDSDGMRIQAAAGDTVRIAASVSASGGYAECATVGNAVTFSAVNSTEWIALSYVGTWTVN